MDGARAFLTPLPARALSTHDCCQGTELLEDISGPKLNLCAGGMEQGQEYGGEDMLSPVTFPPGTAPKPQYLIGPRSQSTGWPEAERVPGSVCV